MKQKGWFTGIVHLENLPDDIYLDLHPSLRKKIIRILRKDAKSLCTLAEELGEPIRVDIMKNKYVHRQSYTLTSFISGHNLSLRLLKRISAFLVSKGYQEFNLRKIESKLKLIKASHRGNPVSHPKFPINFNSVDGAIVISAMLHDGCIDVHHRVQYSNKNLELTKKLINSAKRVFGKFSVKISHNTFFPTIIGKILIFGLGMSPGRKTANNVEIPHFLKHQNLHVFQKFLQQAFDDEACVSRHSIFFSLSVDENSGKRNPPKLLLDDIFLLKKLGIKFNGPYLVERHLCKDGRILHQWEISIDSIENLLHFFTKIGFSFSEKSQKLKKIIEKATENLRKRTERKNKLLNTLKEIQETHGKITSKLLAEKLYLPLSTASYWLTRFSKCGEIKLIHKSHKPYRKRRIFIMNIKIN